MILHEAITLNTEKVTQARFEELCRNTLVDLGDLLDDCLDDNQNSQILAKARLVHRFYGIVANNEMVGVALTIEQMSQFNNGTTNIGGLSTSGGEYSHLIMQGSEGTVSITPEFDIQHTIDALPERIINFQDDKNENIENIAFDNAILALITNGQPGVERIICRIHKSLFFGNQDIQLLLIRAHNPALANKVTSLSSNLNII